MAQGRRHAMRFLFDVIQPFFPVDEPRQPPHRWIAMLTAEVQFTRIKALIIVARRRLDHIMVGAIALDHHAPAARAAPSATGHLREQLESAFAAAKIRQEQANVRRHDAN